MKKLSIVAIVLSLIAIGGQVFIFATQKEDPDEVYRQAMQADYRVYAPVLPDTLFFCGEPIPLDTYYVREALDRELLVNLYWQSNALLWMKRAGRYFPEIEPILRRNNIPSDMKYLCVIESGLTNATSPAKAQGYWQFMKTTGQRFGLEITEEVDMRNDIEQSTEAACKYLKALHDRFGSWVSAAAAYNCGEGGLNSRLTRQGVNNYFDVRLPNETMRYVYRILAAKLLMTHPQDYGFYIRESDLYPVLPFVTDTLRGQNVDLNAYAKLHGTNYKMLREFNPWLQTEKLTNKNNRTYVVKLPTRDGLSVRKMRRKQSNDLVKSL